MRKKRISSLILAISLFCTMMPSGVYADNAGVTSDTEDTVAAVETAASDDAMIESMQKLKEAVFQDSQADSSDGQDEEKSNRLVILTDKNIGKYLEDAETVSYQGLTVAAFDTVSEAKAAMENLSSISGVAVEMDGKFVSCGNGGLENTVVNDGASLPQTSEDSSINESAFEDDAQALDNANTENPEGSADNETQNNDAIVFDSESTGSDFVIDKTSDDIEAAVIDANEGGNDHQIASDDGSSSVSDKITGQTDTENSAVSDQEDTSGETAAADVAGQDNSKKVNAEETLQEKVHNRDMYLTALIDTGTSGTEEPVIDLTGSQNSDENGQGTHDAEELMDASYNKAYIQPFKVTGADGEGTLADVCAAMRYAIDENADYIVIPMTMERENSPVFEALAEEAENNGIVVIASAGEGNGNASSMTPAHIENIMVAGACGANGEKNDNTCTGDTVDYYLPVGCTAEAAAMLAGYLMSCRAADSSLSDYETSGMIYSRLVEKTDEDEIDVSDVPSTRILFATDNPSIIRDTDTVTGQYKGLYLIQYVTKAEAKKAYLYYSENADFADYDTEIAAAGGETVISGCGNLNSGSEKITETKADSTVVSGSEVDSKEFGNTAQPETEKSLVSKVQDNTQNPEKATETNVETDEIAADASGKVMTEDDNPLTELSLRMIEADKNNVKKDEKKPLIALIDTGVPEGHSNVSEAISVIEDSPYDNYGHGTDMLNDIVSQYPEASVLSIRALDKNGKGDVSAVAAAIQYAIEKKADIINLSMSAVATEKNAILTEVVKKAVEAGIIVVGAAGNNGKNVKYYTPGGIDEAVIIGACDETGQRIDSSNYGDTVDYYVTADSTSEAAAKFSGYIASLIQKNGNWKDSILKDHDGIAYSADGQKVATDEDDDPVQGDDQLHTAGTHTVTFKIHIENYWRDENGNKGTACNVQGVEYTAWDPDASKNQKISKGVSDHYGNIQFSITTDKWPVAIKRTAVPSEYNSINAEPFLEYVNEPSGNITKSYTHYITGKYHAIPFYLNPMGGKQDGKTSNVSKWATVGEYVDSITPPTRAGYKFLGYFGQGMGGGDNSHPKYIASNGRASLAYRCRKWSAGGHNTYILTADWEAKSTRLYLDEYSSWAYETVTTDETYGSLPSPSKTGYDFLGWYKDGTHIYSSTKVTGEDVDNGPIHLTPKWKRQQYSIEYYDYLELNNGGTEYIQDGSQNYYYDNDTYHSSFSAFSSPDSSIYSYDYGSPSGFYATEAKTIFRYYKYNTYYTLKHADGTTQNVYYDAKKNETVSCDIENNRRRYENPVPVSYSGNIVKNSDTYFTYAASNYGYKGTITLGYNKYTLTLDPNGGTCNTPSITQYYNSKWGNLDTPTRDGYSFAGWYTSPTGGTQITANTVCKDDTVAYAHWTYNLHFEPNKVTDSYGNDVAISGSMDDESMTYGVPKAVSDCGFTCPYYIFTGWNTKPDGTGIPVSDKALLSQNPDSAAKDSTLTLYAQWKLEQYNITYEGCGDGVHNPNPAACAPHYGDFTLADPSKRDMVFLGWTVRTSGGTPVLNTAAKNLTITRKMQSSDLIITAHWKEVEPYSFVNKDTMGMPHLLQKDTDEGKYKIVEVKPADGYVNNYESKEINVSDADSEGIIQVDFDNEKNKYTIKKTETNNKPLSGVTFNVWYENDQDNAKTYTTGDDGLITLSGLKPGTWHYQEMSTVNGYRVDSFIHSIKIDSNGQPMGTDIREIVNQNQDSAKIFLVKNSDMGSPIAGAEFNITRPDGTSFTRKTNDNGMITINAVDGAYTYSEVSVPQPYIHDSTVGTFTVSNSLLTTGGYYVTVTDKVNKLIITKRNSDDDQPIIGVVFKIWKTGDEQNAVNITTGDEGKAELDGLTSGTWNYQEITTIPGYIVDTTVHQVTVSDDCLIDGQVEKEISLTNTPNKFVIRKQDQDGNPLAGVQFRIYSDNRYDETKTTDRDGLITLTKLSAGTYHYTEITKQGYAADTQERTFVVSDNGTVSPEQSDNIVNIENSLTFKKVDVNGNPVSGVKIKFTYDGKYSNPFINNSEYTTPADGIIRFTELPTGNYTLTEVSVPDEKYVMDNNVHYFTVTESGTLTASDSAIAVEGSRTPAMTLTMTNKTYPKFSIRLYKTDADTNAVLTGAEFTLYEWNGTDYEVKGKLSDAKVSGTYVYDDLQTTLKNAGKYRIVETKLPDGYANAYTKDFQIDESMTDQAMTKEFSAENTPNEVVIRKVNENSRVIKGVEFKIWNDGNVSSAETKTTGEDGRIILKGLTPGTWYYQETKTLKHYKLDPVQHSFVVATDGTINGEAKTMLPDVINTPQVPKEIIVKLKKTNESGDIITNAQFNLMQWSEKTGQYELASLMNYSSAEQVYTNDAHVFWTDDNEGKFKIEEVKAPEGYTCSYVKTFSATNDDALEETFTFNAVNTKNSLVINKRDQDGKALAGALFSLTKQDEETAAYTATSDASGKAVFTGIAQGLYTLKETGTPTGYVADASETAVTVTDKGLIYTGVDSENAQGTVTLNKVNTQNKFIIWKTDKDKNALSGAVFRIWRAGGSSTSYTTGADGEIVVKGLQPGTWYFQETKSPDGYALPDNVYTFKVNNDSTITVNDNMQNLTTARYRVINGDYPTGTVKIRKTDKNGNVINNVKFIIEQYSAKTKDYSTIMESDDLFANLLYLKYNADTGYYETSLKWTSDNMGMFKIVELYPAKGYKGKWSADINLAEKLNWVFDDASSEHPDYNGKVVNENNEFNVLKTDSYTGEPIEGIRFKFWKDSNISSAFTRDTDEEGKIHLEGLDNDTTYYYQETEDGPNKSYVTDTTLRSFTVDQYGYINDEEKYTEKIENTPKNAYGKLLIKKVNSDDNSLVSDVTFHIHQWNRYINAYEESDYATMNFGENYNIATGLYELPVLLQYTDMNLGKFRIEETESDHPITYVGRWQEDISFDLTGNAVHTFGTDSLENGDHYIVAKNHPIAISTLAEDDITGANIQIPYDDASITDTVYFHNLEWGKTYTVAGNIMAQDDNGNIDLYKDTKGNTVTGSTEFRLSDDGKSVTILEQKVNGKTGFTTEEDTPQWGIEKQTKNSELPNGVSDGWIKVHFALDSSENGGDTVVVYENLYNDKGQTVARHEDINDDNQTIQLIVPELHTTLVDSGHKDQAGNIIKGTMDHIGHVSETDVLRDTVKMQGLSKKATYVLEGTLVYKYDYTEEKTENGKTVTVLHKAGETVTDADGKPVTAHKEFKAEEGTLVHEDGELYDANGETIKAPDKGTGYVNVEFNLNSTNLENATVLAYEKLFLKKANGRIIELTDHSDLTDVSQSVYYPRVRTDAVSGNTETKVGTKDGLQTITDTVDLKGLKKATATKWDDNGTPTEYENTSYTLRARLMSRSDNGKQVCDTNGTPIEKYVDIEVDKDGNVKAYKADKQGAILENGSKQPDNTVTITTSGDTNAELVNAVLTLSVTVPGECTEGITTVMYEDLIHNNVVVAKHTDINDEKQTVRHPFYVHLKTGGTGNRLLYISCAGILAFAILMALKKKRKHMTNR